MIEGFTWGSDGEDRGRYGRREDGFMVVSRAVGEREKRKESGNEGQ